MLSGFTGIIAISTGYRRDYQENDFGSDAKCFLGSGNDFGSAGNVRRGVADGFGSGAKWFSGSGKGVGSGGKCPAMGRQEVRK